LFEKAKDLNFFYSLNLNNDINYFDRMPDSTQASIERHIVNVIYESFALPADHDYLTARLLAQKGLTRGFYWAAAQAVEKYLKAFLLMHGVGVDTNEFIGHPLVKLWNAASRINNTLQNLDIIPHESMHVEPSSAIHLKKYTINDYLDVLEKYGSPDNRYNAFGLKYNTGHLCALDSFCAKLRPKIGVIRIEESFKNLSPDLILSFEHYNPWFASKDSQALSEIPNKDFPIKYGISFTHLDFLIKNEISNECGLALQWLRSKMRLPKK
jgi:HEPN domain-containing protein